MNFFGIDFDYQQYLRQRNVQINLILFIVVIIAISGFYAYKWHTDRVQKFAQKIFSESMDSYKQALGMEFSKDVSEKDKQNMWSEVEIAFKTGYLQNKSSTLAPFFLAYEAQALLHQNKKSEAFNLIDNAVSNLKKGSEFSYLYKITYALMKIDSGDVESGVSDLTSLSVDKNNSFNDMALYYLGEYYQSIGDIEKSKNQFSQIVSMKSDKNAESPWINLANTKLAQIK